jgi:hypothetical protein
MSEPYTKQDMSKTPHKFIAKPGATKKEGEIRRKQKITNIPNTLSPVLNLYIKQQSQLKW